MVLRASAGLDCRGAVGDQVSLSCLDWAVAGHFCWAEDWEAWTEASAITERWTGECWAGVVVLGGLRSLPLQASISGKFEATPNFYTLRHRQDPFPVLTDFP